MSTSLPNTDAGDNTRLFGTGQKLPFAGMKTLPVNGGKTLLLLLLGDAAAKQRSNDGDDITAITTQMQNGTTRFTWVIASSRVAKRLLTIRFCG
jgi:hypothetical protein